MSMGGQDDSLFYEEDLAMHRDTVAAADWNNAKQHMLSVINIMGDGEDQRMAVQMLHRMEMTGKTQEEIMASLAIMLRDIVLS
jgi:hypothetical protein